MADRINPFNLNSIALAALVLLAPALSGCDSQDVHQAIQRIRLAASDLMGTRKTASVAAPSPVPAERKLKDDTEILREVFQVVLLREPYGPEEFGSFVNTLSQGASIEGIYNGIVGSAYYRELEDKSPPADAETLGVFSDLVSSLEQEMGGKGGGDLEVDPPFTRARLEAGYRSASLFRLKRIAGNVAERVIEAKLGPQKNREALIGWYAGWAARMAGLRVDFGLPLRNNPDPGFHKAWALSLPPELFPDRLAWEVLNRVHRVLNATEARTHGG